MGTPREKRAGSFLGAARSIKIVTEGEKPLTKGKNESAQRERKKNDYQHEGEDTQQQQGRANI